ncbi:Bloom syndrome helicase [Carabus blaptoides fortunei]
MSTAEEIDTEIKKTEAEISVTNQKRIEINTKLQQLNARLDKLQKQYSSLKSKEVSKIDWASNTYEWQSKIQDILEKKFKLKKFRHQQLSAINAVLSGKDIILLMPTGGGKSLCYQLPALFSKGITLVVSPLLSLIDDQIMALRKLEIEAITLNSRNSKTESKKVFEALKTGTSPLKLIYVTPEWMAKSKLFMSYLQKCYDRKGLDRIAIDEVHCCSQWGHDFRPDYKFLGILKNIFPNTALMGLTATATENIICDAQHMLDIEGCLVLRASYNRPNLYYEVRQKPSSQEQCFYLLENLLTRRYKDQSGIIYTTTINDCSEITKYLRGRGLRIACYHANMATEVRQTIHRKWLSEYYQAVVATVAFGMGIDKPNVRFVIHHCLSKSVENFYQESGRAGRDDERADCILLYSLKDVFRISSMVSTTASGTENLYKLVEYCLDLSKCRRSLIASHFDETWTSADCNNMCDHCKNTSSYDTIDITKHFKDLVTIIEYAEKSETRLTASVHQNSQNRL